VSLKAPRAGNFLAPGLATAFPPMEWNLLGVISTEHGPAGNGKLSGPAVIRTRGRDRRWCLRALNPGGWPKFETAGVMRMTSRTARPSNSEVPRMIEFAVNATAPGTVVGDSPVERVNVFGSRWRPRPGDYMLGFLAVKLAPSCSTMTHKSFLFPSLSDVVAER